jgi:hypothetical protein
MHGSPPVPSPNVLICIIRHLFVEIIKINQLRRHDHKAKARILTYHFLEGNLVTAFTMFL